MRHASPLTLRSELIRYQTIALLYRLTTKADELELPKPSMTLTSARHQLEENRYNVLVVGEAKPGKSTFVNALIGQNILPTGVERAMTQAFRVCHAEQAAYRLRFEDGSQQEIPADALLQYGAHVVEDSAGKARLGQIMRCIEVEGPMPFLPEGVSIWDTPGLGSHRATQTHIMQRFVPHADAVIYVLDSRQPMDQSDLEFVETILRATPHIFFIQTKIDQYDRAYWERVQQRNQALLSERFAPRLSDRRVWPVSSTHLLQAVQTGHEEYVTQSYHQDMSAALQTFLLRVAGWSHSAEAVVRAKHYHALARQTLVGRLATLTEASKEQLASLQQAAVERQQQFDTAWGQAGTKRQELMTHLQKVMTIGRRNFETALQQGGDIEHTMQRQIDALTSMNEARQLGQRLNEDVVTAALSRWLQVCEFTQTECVTLMTPFFAEAITLPQETSQPHLDLGSEPIIAEEWVSKLQAGRKEMLTLSGIASLPLTVLFGASVVSGPVGMLALAATGLWGFMRGWTTFEHGQLNEARNRLSKHLSSLMQEVRHYFFNIRLATDGLSVVDQYFEDLWRFITERMEALVTQKSSEARAEVARMVADAPLHDEQRHVKAQQLQQQLADWDSIGTTIQNIMAGLEALEHSL